jgi:hypothetical protein
MAYLRYLCLFAHSSVQCIFCCVCLYLVCTMLPVSLDGPFLIVPSVCSNVYLDTNNCVSNREETITQLNKPDRHDNS